VVAEGLLNVVACPVDRSELQLLEDGLTCVSAGHRYLRGDHGYFELADQGSPVLAIQSTSGECAHIQEAAGDRAYEVYLRPWLAQQKTSRILDAGCGLGAGITAARADGYEATGIDMRAVADHWHRNDRDRDGFVVGDVTQMPFADDVFDVAMALGVIEHVGTSTGHLTLAADWREKRAAFARELYRVVRPGGRIIIACPNKWFPIDIQHGPTDELTAAPLRGRVFERFGVNVHQTWGAYHLASYADLNRWFGRSRVRPLPLTGYFGFSALDRPGVPKLAGNAARVWIERLPTNLRATPINPYLLAEVRVG
jgi:SAM-dependent methyltransferase